MFGYVRTLTYLVDPGSGGNPAFPGPTLIIRINSVRAAQNPVILILDKGLEIYERFDSD